MALLSLRLEMCKRLGVLPLGNRLRLRYGIGHGLTGLLLLTVEGTPQILDLLPPNTARGVRTGLQVDLCSGFRTSIGLGDAHF